MENVSLYIIIGLVVALIFERNRRQKAQVKSDLADTSIKSAKNDAELDRNKEALKENAKKIEEVKKDSSDPLSYWVEKFRSKK
jgi:FtsZ-interacting cell division protein ZipA